MELMKIPKSVISNKKRITLSEITGNLFTVCWNWNGNVKHRRQWSHSALLGQWQAACLATHVLHLTVGVVSVCLVII